MARKTPPKPPTRDEAALERFQSHVALDKTGCWIWTLTPDPDGYGQFKVGGKTRQAHVWRWEQETGQRLPKGFELDHQCEEERCVNPKHLRLVTHDENIRRKTEAQRRRDGNRVRPPVSIDLDAPPLAGQAQCAEDGCKRGLWFEGRRRPQKCWEHCSHLPSWNERTVLRIVPVDPSKAAVTNERTRQMFSFAKRFDEYMRAVTVAAYADIFGDAKSAAEFVLMIESLDADDPPPLDELAVHRLAELAMSDDMKAVREAQTAYHAKLAGHARTLSLHRAIKVTPFVKPDGIAMHTKLIHTIAEELGGSDAGHQEIKLELIIETAEAA